MEMIFVSRKLESLIEERENLYLEVLLLVESGASSEEISNMNRRIEKLNLQISLEQ
ncbi:hypothetical protein HMPREF1092_01802 [Clostridium thermobutyricum]|uniref:Uncharacterized protein n=1 Tax=Clostridium thermobutyricum TaxID=29372 RepID=N9Y408_9CLOT|nr:hypothetical protein HMPREF1092_01802 [Clostridium thermobutyricum]